MGGKAPKAGGDRKLPPAAIPAHRSTRLNPAAATDTAAEAAPTTGVRSRTSRLPRKPQVSPLPEHIDPQALDTDTPLSDAGSDDSSRNRDTSFSDLEPSVAHPNDGGAEGTVAATDEQPLRTALARVHGSGLAIPFRGYEDAEDSEDVSQILWSSPTQDDASPTVRAAARRVAGVITVEEQQAIDDMERFLELSPSPQRVALPHGADAPAASTDPTTSTVLANAQSHPSHETIAAPAASVLANAQPQPSHETIAAPAASVLANAQPQPSHETIAAPAASAHIPTTVTIPAFAVLPEPAPIRASAPASLSSAGAPSISTTSASAHTVPSTSPVIPISTLSAPASHPTHASLPISATLDVPASAASVLAAAGTISTIISTATSSSALVSDTPAAPASVSPADGPTDGASAELDAGASQHQSRSPQLQQCDDASRPLSRSTTSWDELATVIWQPHLPEDRHPYLQSAPPITSFEDPREVLREVEKRLQQPGADTAVHGATDPGRPSQEEVEDYALFANTIGKLAIFLKAHYGASAARLSECLPDDIREAAAAARPGTTHVWNAFQRCCSVLHPEWSHAEVQADWQRLKTGLQHTDLWPVAVKMIQLQASLYSVASKTSVHIPPERAAALRHRHFNDYANAELQEIARLQLHDLDKITFLVSLHPDDGTQYARVLSDNDAAKAFFDVDGRPGAERKAVDLQSYLKGVNVLRQSAAHTMRLHEYNITDNTPIYFDLPPSYKPVAVAEDRAPAPTFIPSTFRHHQQQQQQSPPPQLLPQPPQQSPQPPQPSPPLQLQQPSPQHLPGPSQPPKPPQQSKRPQPQGAGSPEPVQSYFFRATPVPDSEEETSQYLARLTDGRASSGEAARSAAASETDAAGPWRARNLVKPLQQGPPSEKDVNAVSSMLQTPPEEVHEHLDVEMEDSSTEEYCNPYYELPQELQRGLTRREFEKLPWSSYDCFHSTWQEVNAMDRNLIRKTLLCEIYNYLGSKGLIKLKSHHHSQLNQFLIELPVQHGLRWAGWPVRNGPAPQWKLFGDVNNWEKKTLLNMACQQWRDVLWALYRGHLILESFPRGGYGTGEPVVKCTVPPLEDDTAGPRRMCFGLTYFTAGNEACNMLQASQHTQQPAVALWPKLTLEEIGGMANVKRAATDTPDDDPASKHRRTRTTSRAEASPSPPPAVPAAKRASGSGQLLSLSHVELVVHKPKAARGSSGATTTRVDTSESSYEEEDELSQDSEYRPPHRGPKKATRFVAAKHDNGAKLPRQATSHAHKPTLQPPYQPDKKRQDEQQAPLPVRKQQKQAKGAGQGSKVEAKQRVVEPPSKQQLSKRQMKPEPIPILPFSKRFVDLTANELMELSGEQLAKADRDELIAAFGAWPSVAGTAAMSRLKTYKEAERAGEAAAKEALQQEAKRLMELMG
ncbi:hypothetical protein CALVIDRAFT_524375 [Calocera viscosa TUFC12733]|uniref:Uncharacterized protein n=1 Tax=Calocera viscosa (strain TUFC12733) TaxID=1330018 RepID=A0A167RU55_CALVF|nr:hypothetical protein CALVIDRAFT_524375 [Calocera viscosa TUFC12733]